MAADRDMLTITVVYKKLPSPYQTPPSSTPYDKIRLNTIHFVTNRQTPDRQTDRQTHRVVSSTVSAVGKT